MSIILHTTSRDCSSFSTPHRPFKRCHFASLEESSYEIKDLSSKVAQRLSNLRYFAESPNWDYEFQLHFQNAVRFQYQRKGISASINFLPPRTYLVYILFRYCMIHKLSKQFCKMQLQYTVLNAILATLSAAQTLNIPSRVGSIVLFQSPALYLASNTWEIRNLTAGAPATRVGIPEVAAPSSSSRTMLPFLTLS
jgi:hypothetical protein